MLDEVYNMNVEGINKEKERLELNKNRLNSKEKNGINIYGYDLNDDSIHNFNAVRQWNIKKLNVYFGKKCYKFLLEKCSNNCVCWNDEFAGFRIGYILQELINIKIDEQGWILNDNKIIEYFDQNISKLLWDDDNTLNDISLTIFKRTHT